MPPTHLQRGRVSQSERNGLRLRHLESDFLAEGGFRQTGQVDMETCVGTWLILLTVSPPDIIP